MVIPTAPLMGNADEGVMDRSVVDKLVLVERTSVVFLIVDVGSVVEIVRMVGTYTKNGIT